MGTIEIIRNNCPKSACTRALELMRPAEMKKVRAFHKSFPQYTQTPLVKLEALAAKLNVRGIYVQMQEPQADA
ncbi:MAG: hypothetical protein FWC64_05700 [Treponema sp.]|nr:hypothetical protein [Treponema sp.]